MPVLYIRSRRSPPFGRRPTARRCASLLLSGLFLIAPPGAIALAQEIPPAMQTAADPHAAHIAEAAMRFAIPEHWIRAVMRIESAYNEHGVSSAGAQGLMQIMPETWADLRRRHRLGADPFDPRDNILAGAAYLREMFDRYGNVGAMLAAYNAGPARYDEYLATGRALPAETRAYVATLAPMLDGAAPVWAVARPVDWREASLFVGIVDAAHVQAGGSAMASPAETGGLAPSASGDLFAPGAGGESSQ
ncbi:MAG: lytic transglycosylase domain-containing protein [Paracoccus denitrificans]|uniref:Lytic transglycosylase domain-containing protein n=1 Tax=Paracoccus denitrificans TaxID=266 RepID=A0A533I512_PARDE|nr:MAG: lytic transglycosylase domain-containing protein [Paracoccus denitrificans]